MFQFIYKVLRRYWQFFSLASTTRFFSFRSTTTTTSPSISSTIHNNSKNGSSENTPENVLSRTQQLHTGSEFTKKMSVASVIFPTSFVIYMIKVAVSDVIRYTLLLQTVGIQKKSLAIIVGFSDFMLAIMDVLVRIHGWWDVQKSLIVEKKVSAIIAATLYVVGVMIISSGCAYFGCHANGSLNVKTGKDYCPNIRYAIASFIAGSFLMKVGVGLLWNVWTQVLKSQAQKRLDETFLQQNSTRTSSSQHSGEHETAIDFQGKMAQGQVVLRYIASFVAPLMATGLLTTTGPIVSYCVVGAFFAVLAAVFANFLRMLDQTRNHQAANTSMSARSRTGTAPTSTTNIGWEEMLPSCFSSFFQTLANYVALLVGRRTEERTPLLFTNNSNAGRFSKAFFHCGMFSCFTESIRSGYTRVICLRAATSDLSHAELAHILALVGGVATASFWLSDIADSNRRLAAFLSFSILGVGHFGLSLSSSIVGFYLSSICFGLGEGLSSGLRALIKQDYLDKDGPIGHLTENISVLGLESDGKIHRRQVCNKIAIWADATLVINALVVGVIGQYFGMRLASFAYGVLAIFAAYFVAQIMPNTKPGRVSEDPLFREVSCLSPES